MYNITIRFYEELNDFLPFNNRKRDIDFSFKGQRSVKDLVESMGVPHVEVDLILVNGKSVDFSYIVKDSDRISVYPVFETLSIEKVTHLREFPLRSVKFLLDVHLRKLAKKMRLLGFDVDYEKERDDQTLAKISEEENRILLTRDRGLLKRKNVTRGLMIRNTDPAKQIVEVIERLDLFSWIKPFTRCISCNGEIFRLYLDDESGKKLKHKIPEGVLKWCKEYYYCRCCEKVYWPGSHYEKLKRFVDKLIQGPS